jgi:hypothetical protein
VVDLQAMLDASGLKSFDGMINLRASFTGHNGDLILANGSVDQTGTYVFEVRPQGIGQSIGTITGYWSVADGNDSMFSLWNPTDTPQDIIATLYYGDGSGRYHFPVHLAPQASITIDVAMLIRGQQPDADGKIIPSSVREGSASFDTAGRDGNAPDGKKLVTMVISGGLYNVTNATCGMNCTYCNGYSNFVLNPSSLFCLVGCTAQFNVQATDSYGNPQTLQASSWSSSNGAVMSVNNSGAAQALGSGQTSIYAYLNGIMVQQGSFCVSDNMTPVCATYNVSASAQVTVAPALNSISPAQGAIGATTPVTLYGNGFGSGCANVTISAGSAITVSCSSVNSTQIQASFAVSASASGGNQSVNVKVNGQTSPTLNFYVQIPTYFFSPSAAQTGTPSACVQEGFTGYFIDVSYYVAAQNSSRVSQSGMAPGENVGSGWNDAFATPTTTRSDGSFDDTPNGSCYGTSGHFCALANPQSFRLTINGTVFSIATNTTRRTCTDGIQLVIQGNPTGQNKTYTFGNTQ